MGIFTINYHIILLTSVGKLFISYFLAFQFLISKLLIELELILYWSQIKVKNHWPEFLNRIKQKDIK